MNAAAVDTLRAIEQWTPVLLLVLIGLALVLSVSWAVRRVRAHREAVLRDLELGIEHPRRLLPLWAHGLIGFVLFTGVSAAVLLPWLLLAATHERLPASAVVPGLVGDSILIATPVAVMFAGVVAVRRRWVATTQAARTAGTAFAVRSARHRFQPEEMDS